MSDDRPMPATAATTRLLTPLRAARAIGPDALALSVHGLVLFVAVMGATFVADYPAWKMLVYSGGAVALFWCAHVYSGVLADQHIAGARPRRGAAIVWHEAARTLPLLESCIAPAVPLVFSAIGILPATAGYVTSLTVALVTLALVGFLALHNRRASWRRSLAAAVVTAGFGAAIIAAETFLH